LEKNYFFKLSTFFSLFLVLTSSLLYSQDISVKSITVNDNAAVCSNAPLDSDIIIEFETNQAFDFSPYLRNKRGVYRRISIDNNY